jgi:hypothetical protein
MEKNIILELERIKSLMRVITEQGSADIIDRQRSEKQLANAPDRFGPTDEYSVIEIGQGTDYPVILPDYTTTIMGDPNPHLSQSSGKISAANFIKDVEVDENGEEYTVKNGKKYCLPTKESGFWQLLSNGNNVYKFVNPKNGMVFSMVLTTKPNVTVPIVKPDGTVANENISGAEASIRCVGGDNGWGFKLSEGILFWNKDNVSYNPSNPEHFDTRSSFDEWWDKWGYLVEIIVGVGAAITGAWLAGVLIESGTILGALTASYAGGSETILSVVLQATIELGLMAPIAKYQWERGKESDAILSIAFAFLPFLIELKGVQKYMKGGINPNVSRTLQEKFISFGGTDAINSTKQSYGQFLESLTGSELMLFKATVDQFSTKQGAKQFDSALKEYIKKNEIKINNEIYTNKVWKEQIDDMTAGGFTKMMKQSPIKGTGVLAQLIRVGVPIGGVAIGFSKIYNNLKKMGYNDTQIEKVGKSLEDSLKSNEYLMGLVKIDQKLYKSLLEKALIEYTSKKENVDGILNNKVVSSKIQSDVLNAAIKIIENDPKTYQPFIKFTQSDDLLNQFFKAGLMTYLEDKGHENVIFKEETPFKSYKFSSSLAPNGELTFKLPTNFTTNKEVRIYDYENGVEIKTI